MSAAPKKPRAGVSAVNDGKVSGAGFSSKMKTLYLDCAAGAAGDMLSAALLSLLPDPAGAVARLNAIGVPGVEYVLERVSRCGVAALRLAVSVGGKEEGHGHSHAHAHDHHHHEHRTLGEMLDIVGALSLPEEAKSAALDVYRLLAEAESRAHGRPVGEVHFHEVGAFDAVADIAAFCLLVSEIAPDEIVASAVNVGGGTVRCAHGTLPVPAPATAFLLEGLPVHGDLESRGELCTPTGAALLRRFVGSFGPLPPMRVTGSGFGAGTRDVADRANVVRAVLGESEDLSCGGFQEEVRELKCNLDDMTGEEVAFACERLFEAGALDVFTVPATMKKGRPGIVLTALCSPGARDAVAAAMFRHTSTIGVRETACRRGVMLRREEVVPLPGGGTARRKVSEGFGASRAKFEHDDVAALARERGVTLREAQRLAEASAP